MPEDVVLRHYYEDVYSRNRLTHLGDKSLAFFDRRAEAQVAFIAESGFFGSSDCQGYFAGKLVLEIGCGAGSLLKILESYNASVAGIEADAAILEIARRRLSSKALLSKGLFQFGTFASGSFDLVLASHVLEHATDPARFIAELLRLTKPGGALFIEVPNCGLGRVRKMIRRRYKGSGHLLFFDKKSLTYLIDDSQGTLVSLETFGPDSSRVYVPFGSAESIIQRQLQRVEKLASKVQASVIGGKEVVLDGTMLDMKPPNGSEGIMIRALVVP